MHWHKKSCFLRFGWVFKATRGVKIELVPKKSYFCWNYKVKSAISSTAIKHPKTPNFLNILAIFQNNLVKRMGKALVPAVPRLFSHLSHPSIVSVSYRYRNFSAGWYQYRIGIEKSGIEDLCAGLKKQWSKRKICPKVNPLSECHCTSVVLNIWWRSLLHVVCNSRH